MSDNDRNNPSSTYGGQPRDPLQELEKLFGLARAKYSNQPTPPTSHAPVLASEHTSSESKTEVPEETNNLIAELPLYHADDQNWGDENNTGFSEPPLDHNEAQNWVEKSTTSFNHTNPQKVNFSLSYGTPPEIPTTSNNNPNPISSAPSEGDFFDEDTLSNELEALLLEPTTRGSEQNQTHRASASLAQGNKIQDSSSILNDSPAIESVSPLMGGQSTPTALDTSYGANFAAYDNLFEESSTNRAPQSSDITAYDPFGLEDLSQAPEIIPHTTSKGESNPSAYERDASTFEAEVDSYTKTPELYSETASPIVDSYSFADEKVEKTELIDIPEVNQLETANEVVQTLENDLADAFGSFSEESNTASEAQVDADAFFNEIFNADEAAASNVKSDVPLQAYPWDIGDQTAVMASAAALSGAAALAAQSKHKGSRFGKRLALPSLLALILLGGGYGIYHFLALDNNISPTIIHADKRAVKSKPETLSHDEDTPISQDVYKQAQGEQNYNVTAQNVLIDHSETPKSLPHFVVSPQNDDSSPPLPSEDSSRVIQQVVVKPDGSIISFPYEEYTAAEKQDNNQNFANTEDTIVSDPSESTINDDSLFTNDSTIKPPSDIESSLDISSIIAQNKDISESELHATAPMPEDDIGRTIQANNLAATTNEIPLQNIPIPSPKTSTTNTPTSKAQTTHANYYVQIASPATKESAKRFISWARNFYGAILRPYHLGIAPTTINGSTRYRVRISISTLNEAKSVCEQIRDAGGNCFINQ